MRINIVQTDYDPTDIEMRYLNKVSDETKRIIETVKKTGKTVILPLI